MLLRVVLALALVLPFTLAAQEAPKKETYKVDYVVTELDNGKKVDSRSYTLLLSPVVGSRDSSPEASGRIRIGSRIPIAHSTAGTPPTMQFTYTDVGMNIDARVTPVGDTMANVSSTLNFNGIAVENPEDRAKAGFPNNPIIRNVTAENRTTSSFGKTATIFVMDEPGSKRAVQIQMTVNRVANP